MRREQLEHIIRASAEVCEEPDFVIIGSQAIHGSLREIADGTLTRSMEADLYPLHAPHKSELLNEIGVLSRFHETYGYYADGVDESTAVLPAGWRDRLVRISGPLTENRHGFRASGWCLEIHDLIISKLVANREKDLEFFQALVLLGKTDAGTLNERLAMTDTKKALRRLIAAQIDAATS